MWHLAMCCLLQSLLLRATFQLQSVLETTDGLDHIGCSDGWSVFSLVQEVHGYYLYWSSWMALHIIDHRWCAYISSIELGEKGLFPPWFCSLLNGHGHFQNSQLLIERCEESMGRRLCNRMHGSGWPGSGYPCMPSSSLKFYTPVLYMGLHLKTSKKEQLDRMQQPT